MRILYVTLNWAPLGGMEIYSRHVVTTLRRLGHAVDVWSYNEANQDLARLDSKVNSLAPQSVLARSLYFRVGAWVLAARLLPVAREYDLVIAGHPIVAPVMYLANQLCRGLRYWIWTYGRDIWGEWSLLLRRALLGAERVLTISNFTKERILQRLPDVSVTVVPNHVDVERFSYKLRQSGSTPVLLTVSRLDKGARYKGHDIMIQALPVIQRRLAGPPVVYQIAGRGDGVGELRQLAARYGVAQSVEFLGYVAGTDLPSVYHGCDVFVLLSRMQKRPDGSWTGEGFGYVYIEAAACGRPVIASNQGGAVDAVVDGVTGLAVDPTSVEQVADAIYALLANPYIAARMGQAGRRFVEGNFSVEVFERRIADLLES